MYNSYSKPDKFTLCCGGENAHIDTGEVGEGHFPVYSSGQGVRLK